MSERLLHYCQDVTNGVCCDVAIPYEEDYCEAHRFQNRRWTDEDVADAMIDEALCNGGEYL